MKHFFLIIIFFLVLPHAAYTIDENDLGYHLVALFSDIDLNNDGKPENIKITESYKIFTNIPDSEWGDDRGAIINILDEEKSIIYCDEINRYQPVDNVVIEDADGDGLKEVVISIAETQDYEAKTYKYGFKDGKYQALNR